MNKTQTKFVAIIVILIGIVAVCLQNINSTKERIYRLNTECAEQASTFEQEKNDKGLARWQVLQTIFNDKENSCFVEFESGPNFVIYNLTNYKDLVYRGSGQISSEYQQMKENIFGK